MNLHNKAVFSGRRSVRAAYLASVFLGGQMMLTGGAYAQDQAPAAATPAPQAETQASNQDIIVTGSRIARQGFEAPTPTKILNAEAIQLRGSTSIGDFLAEVPSFRNTQGPQTSTQSTLGTGQNSPDLRGLGVIRTLTLVDGRRHVPTAPTGQVDLNLIPQILVDRVDVVTGGASAAYGSDAVAGVVNVILNKKLQGFKGDVSMGISDEGDDREIRASLAYGTAFAGERGHFIIGGEYVDSNGIPNNKMRDFFRDQPGLISYTGTRAADAPSRFYGTGVAFTNMAYGGLIIGSRADLNAGNGTDVLRGIQFGPGGVPMAFNYGNTASFGSTSTLASNFTGGTPGLFPQDGFPIVTPVTRKVVFGHVDYDITEAISLFAEASYGRSGANSFSPPVRDTGTTATAAATIRRENAYLDPSIRAIMTTNGITSFPLGRANNDFGPVSTDNQNTTKRFLAGFDAGLGSNWKLNGYYQYGQNILDAEVSNLRIENNFKFAVDAVNVGGQIVCAATQPNGTVTTGGVVLNRFNAAAAGCTPINLFGQGSPSAAAIDYVTGTLAYRVKTEQQVGSLTLQGDLFNTWAGPVSVAVGGEYREEKASAVSDVISQGGGFNYSNPKAYVGKYNVKEAFGEVVVPLAKDMAFAHLLELNGAIRYTDYSTSGTVTTWKIGGIYAPLPDIRFRVTRSRDIRAPNNSELFATTSTLSQLVNPFNSNSTSQILTLNQPSPSLKPEKADTWTVGTVITPTFIPGLSLSVDYYDIKIKGAIASYTAQNVIDNCFTEFNAGGTPFFCNFIDRSGSTINSVAVQLLNIGSIRERGYDFEGSYRTAVGTGQLTLRGIASYVKDLIFDDGIGNPVRFNGSGVIQSLGSRINRAGAVGGFTNGQQTNATSLPHWTATGSITYSQEPFTFNIQGRYIGGGKFDASLVGPGDKYYDPASPISIGDNRVSGRFYLDLGAQFDVIKDGNRKLQFYMNVNNVTNKEPPFPVIAIAGMYDRIGRYYRGGVRFTY